MDFNIFKIASLLILIVVYLAVRKFFKRVANFTEKLGQSNTQEREDEIEKLNAKISILEQQINHKS
ncbi:hypothetical protein OMO38_15335 [Chryseobacterium sp. 09-1422]|jgi:hypothetical protein|uniref:Uncharacterized protein n=1 Tax=Chryseobacterium kimseyorum TaxID=2984028 RepID=A0ABT3I1G5_9FLAO|nr:hypothetical protein [Chryseobacterium kimseyorum]MCW3169897.1 hypothetical protein [Chryseobacterium kimseyorum]